MTISNVSAAAMSGPGFVATTKLGSVGPLILAQHSNNRNKTTKSDKPKKTTDTTRPETKQAKRRQNNEEDGRIMVRKMRF
mmetsp:Transcript_41533/g.99531  ORF Transcript_41533/g.99531 Transcript_41533/m.99531 type:complete len:80 (+) Transcript_41533:715-954(+)